MVTEAIKTTEITNLDATPPIRGTSGKGAVAREMVATGTAHVTSGKTAGSTYQMVRLPPNAVVKKVEAWLDAAGTTITGDIGIYYSTSTKDGTLVANQGVVINADHFASAVALAAVVTPTEYTFEATTYLGADTRAEVWEATGGLSARPAGMIDVVFTLTSTAGSAADVNFRVTYAVME